MIRDANLRQRYHLILPVRLAEAWGSGYELVREKVATSLAG